MYLPLILLDIAYVEPVEILLMEERRQWGMLKKLVLVGLFKVNILESFC